MPTSIPYDPSLVLGSLVQQNVLDNLEAIATLQAPIDNKQEELNALIMAKRSLKMTMNEIATMGVETDDLATEITTLDSSISAAATQYGQLMVSTIPQITQRKSAIIAVNNDIESPIDYNKTQIKKMPLSSDSLKMDAQYFSFDKNTQTANNTIAQIKSYVSSQTSFLGSKRSVEATAAVNAQLNKQLQNHNLEGTLIITASCTHKEAALLAPFVLDVDKGIRVWNALGKTPLINPDDHKTLKQLAEEEGTGTEDKMTIISGATYGSSFIGMVHVLKSETTETSQKMLAMAGSLQGQMETGGWFASAKGGFGVDASFAHDVKNMLSTQQIASHVSLITMGSIPTIKSGTVQLGVKEFADFDPSAMMGKLATLANSTTAAQGSVAQSAQAARTGQQMLAIRNSEVQSVMTGLGQISDGENQLLDINTLMTAFEDYINKALEGNVGIPVNYYIKPITGAQLAQMWVAKYYPKQYLTISGDDSDDNPTPVPAPLPVAA